MRRLTAKDIGNKKKEEDEPAPDFYALSREHPLPVAPPPAPVSANATISSGAVSGVLYPPPGTVQFPQAIAAAAAAGGSPQGATPAGNGNDGSSSNAKLLADLEFALLEKRRSDILDQINRITTTSAQQNLNGNQPTRATPAPQSVPSSESVQTSNENQAQSDTISNLINSLTQYQQQRGQGPAPVASQNHQAQGIGATAPAPQAVNPNAFLLQLGLNSFLQQTAQQQQQPHAQSLNPLAQIHNQQPSSLDQVQAPGPVPSSQVISQASPPPPVQQVFTQPAPMLAPVGAPQDQQQTMSMLAQLLGGANATSSGGVGRESSTTSSVQTAVAHLGHAGMAGSAPQASQQPQQQNGASNPMVAQLAQLLNGTLNQHQQHP